MNFNNFIGSLLGGSQKTTFNFQRNEDLNMKQMNSQMQQGFQLPIKPKPIIPLDNSNQNINNMNKQPQIQTPEQQFIISQCIINNQNQLIQSLLSKSSDLGKILMIPQLMENKRQQEIITSSKYAQIQLIDQKKEKTKVFTENDSSPGKSDSKSLFQNKRIKKTNVCGHADKEHYAKGMCNNCYHKKGRTRKPWLCQHEIHYAQGLCQNCYINKYNQKRRISSSDQAGINQNQSHSSSNLLENSNQEQMQNLEQKLLQQVDQIEIVPQN